METIGTLFNDKQEVEAGSGLLVGETLIITNNHVVPNANNYKRLEIFIRLKSRLNNPVSATVLARDPDRDLALLQLSTPVSDAGGKRCPIPVVLKPSQAPMGTSVLVLGFPLNQDLSLSGGLISNHGSPPNELRWQTDTVMNPGNSGGPVFEDHGLLLGIAAGGIVQWTFGGETRNVNGVNFFIPARELVASPLYKHINDIAEDKRCWRVAQDDLVVDANTTITVDGTASKAPLGPAKLDRSYTVSETKDDHPVVLASHSRNYQSRFVAEPGYKIVACTPKAESDNNAHDITCNIDTGGGSAVFAYRLESGPAVDRWRGWWVGYVTLRQERIARDGSQ
ncbi:serine protease [Bradyrhizobium sp. NBAIM01]|uniref:S1 family peptidase n=1 Tax=Bradyrhizobium sp. NBAIM01 TaxID=2793818 RepID=UPI001CD30AB4|nr:trypsin-like peptidase domain-containing protein [Bradyrhizobium sp. NBAIM01]